MGNTLAKLPVLAALLGAIALFLVQNRSPTLPLVLFGQATDFELPISLWLLLAGTIGWAISLCGQGLDALSVRSLLRRQRDRKRSGDNPRTEVSSDELPPEADIGSREGRDWNPAPPEQSDWETPKPPLDEEDDEWDIESPPERRSRPNPPSREPAVYSYSYRDDRPRETSVRESQPDGDRVYDANYRVIESPVWDSEEEDAATPVRHTEEDWGFEDDE